MSTIITAATALAKVLKIGKSLESLRHINDLESLADASVSSGTELLNACIELNEKEGKQSKTDKLDPSLLMDACQKGALKQSHIRKVWADLIRRALDPDVHDLPSRADVELLDSLDPLDVLIMYIAHKHRAAMKEAVASMEICKAALSGGNHPRGGHEQFLLTPNLIREYANTEFGNFPVFTDEEVLYAIQTRAKQYTHLVGHRGAVWSIPIVKDQNRWLEPEAEKAGLIDEYGTINVHQPYVLALRPLLPVMNLLRKIN